jgi:hypothetical protein
VTAAIDPRLPADRVDDVDKIQLEMAEAVREALRAHRLAGNPIAVWRNERVEWIPAEDIPDGEAIR